MSSSSRAATPQQRKTVTWVVTITTLCMIFDGYDLVVYGTVVPTLLADPSQIGAVTPVQAGALGSYALIGVLVGALTAGATGDYLGRRKLTVAGIVWFSIGMAATAMAGSVATFGFFRFFTGIGIGLLVATAGAVVAEFAPEGKRNLLNAVTYSGVPVGGVLASLLAIVIPDSIGWRGLMWFGALPILFLLPMALAKMPESPKWLFAAGRVEESYVLARRLGMPLEIDVPAPDRELTASEKADRRRGFSALVTRKYAWPTLLLGLMGFSGLLLTYGLTTWLPDIMGRLGYGADMSLTFLLVLNVGAILGGMIASRPADKFGAKRVVATTFVLAAISMILLTMGLPLVLLLLFVAAAGCGTIGTQVLVYGLVSNYYSSNARAAGVAWCAGFGRLGGIAGPLVGGILIGAGLENIAAFYIFAGIALFGAVVTAIVPARAKNDVVVQDAEQPEPAGV